MPLARLWRRMHDAIEQAEEDARQDAERWILSTWAVANATHDALRFGDELPPTRKEHEERKRAEKSGKDPPINWKEVEQTREQMLESRKLLSYGLQSPAHFAEYLGASGVLDEPEESFEDYKARIDEVDKVSSKKDDAKAAEERLVSMLEAYVGDANAESEN